MNLIYILSASLWLGTMSGSETAGARDPLAGSILILKPNPDSLLKTVLENNPTLRSAWAQYQARLLEAGTGNTPTDPEVEFGYLYGAPSELGNRMDFSVSQEVDFPTAYVYKSRLRKIRSSQAELDYIIARQEVLLQAKTLWIDHIYLNQKERLLARRLNQAREINAHFKQKLESGELSHLAFSQSNLQLTSILGEYEQVRMEIRNIRLALSEMTSGQTPEIPDTLLPAPVPIIPDTLLSVYRMSPQLLRYHQVLQSKEEEKNLAVSKHLPKFKAGYYSETVLDQKLKGFQVGLSVPLWENSRRIKQAKSEISFAEEDAQRFTQRQEREVKQKLEQLESLNYLTALLDQALGDGTSMELLTLSLESGEISLSDYFYASDFYFQQALLLLKYKRDLLVQEAELLKVYL